MNKKRIFGAAIAILLSVTLIFGIQVNSASAAEVPMETITAEGDITTESGIEVDCSNTSSAGVPIGTINAYGGVVTGSDKSELQTQGWLVCDGDEYLIAEYENLYCKIGSYYGTASVPEKFKVPDLRGRFVRGVDSGTGRDPDAGSRGASAPNGNTGDNVGSLQGDEFKTHFHEFIRRKSTTVRDGSPLFEGAGGSDSIQKTKNTGGQETRPKNIYVNWIIKAKDVKPD
ncbi:MAG: phage tail protein [Cyanobacteriota bacterium]|nr:phage tail protein [Cyanobacteriota bacterium]